MKKKTAAAVAAAAAAAELDDARARDGRILARDCLLEQRVDEAGARTPRCIWGSARSVFGLQLGVG